MHWNNNGNVDLKEYSGDFVMVSNMPQNWLNTPKHSAEVVFKIY